MKPIFKVSPTGSKSNLLFALYCGPIGQYNPNLYGRDNVFTREFISEKWYTVQLFWKLFFIHPHFCSISKIYLRWKLSRPRKITIHVAFKHGCKMKLSLTLVTAVGIMTLELVCTLLEITHRSSMVKSEIFLLSKNKRFSCNKIQLFSVSKHIALLESYSLYVHYMH